MTLANLVNAQVISQEQCQEILQEAGHDSDIDFFVTGLIVNNYIPDNPGYTGPIAWVLFGRELLMEVGEPPLDSWIVPEWSFVEPVRAELRRHTPYSMY